MKKQTTQEDNLGRQLTAKWHSWELAKRKIEEDWLVDIRSYNQVNESNQVNQGFHNHIHIGAVRNRCDRAFASILNLMNSRHWDIEDTPIPEVEEGKIDSSELEAINELNGRIERMKILMADQLIDMDYDQAVKDCLLEGCIIGTGVLKGVIPGVRTVHKWVQDNGEWQVVQSEEPYPIMSAPSAFNVYTEPYAFHPKDMTGVFERHIMSHSDLLDLLDNPTFNGDRIKEILKRSPTGQHTPLYHEHQRLQITGQSNSQTIAYTDRYDVLEYWGQVSGHLLHQSGIRDVEETSIYFANVWVCQSYTLHVSLAPMKKQRIPYSFFFYSKVPYQFWGVGPAKKMRSSAAGLNGLLRSTLDSLAMSSLPQTEINVTYLRDKEDVNIIPGKIWIRQGGDMATPVVKFTNMQVPTGQMTELVDLFRSFVDEESAVPSYQNDTENPVSETAFGAMLRKGDSNLSFNQAIVNLEVFGLQPLLESHYDYNMEWADDESVKGDMKVQVLLSSSLMTKEIRVKKILEFLNVTNNALDAKIIDRKYLLEQVAECLDIDAEKAIPNKEVDDQPDPLTQARVQLIAAQTEKEAAMKDKVIADTAGVNVKTQFEGVQTATQVLTNTAVIATTDELLKSAGYKDHNGSPLVAHDAVQNAGEVRPQDIPQNTHPQFPANPQSPEQTQPVAMDSPDNLSKMESPSIGLHTARDDNFEGG